MKTAPITRSQITLIHVLRGKIGMNEENYRDFLSGWRVRSSKDLSFSDARTVINRLKYMAGRRVSVGGNRARYDDLAGREDMATPKQLRMIAGMWADVSWASTAAERESALESFLKNRFNVLSINWLRKSDVQKVVAALRAMKGAKV